jgi:hypothetical protein
VDGSSACDATFNEGKLFHFALDAGYAPDTACTPESACWGAYMGVSGNVGSPRTLQVSLTTAELGGTPIVAGNQDSDDPTAISLQGFAAARGAILPLLLPPALLAFAGAALSRRRKGAKLH